MSDDVQVKGLKELALALEQLPNNVQNNVMRGALRAGARVMADEAKATATFIDRSGLLRKTIQVTASLKYGVIKAHVTAGKREVGKRRAFYAHMVEFGTAAHRIGKRGGTHPGAKAKPFMRPTMDRKSEAAVAAVREYIRARLATKYGIEVPGPDNFDDE